MGCEGGGIRGGEGCVRGYQGGGGVSGSVRNWLITLAQAEPYLRR